MNLEYFYGSGGGLDPSMSDFFITLFFVGH